MVWDELPSAIICLTFLKCCMTNCLDGTEDNMHLDDQADGDPGSEESSHDDLVYPDLHEEPCAFFNEETDDE